MVPQPSQETEQRGPQVAPDGTILMTSRDISLDLFTTPGQLISCQHPFARSPGILWDEVYEENGLLRAAQPLCNPGSSVGLVSRGPKERRRFVDEHHSGAARATSGTAVAAMELAITEIRNILTRTTGFLKTVTSHSVQPYRGCSFGNALCGAGCMSTESGGGQGSPGGSSAFFFRARPNRFCPRSFAIGSPKSCSTRCSRAPRTC